MRKEDNRIDWIDMAKGYGIILVYLGHMDIGKYTNWIYSFHMPLFFFLSGYVFREEPDLDTFLTKKKKTMIVPYFLLGLPLLLYYYIKRYLGGDGDLVRRYSFLLDILCKRAHLLCGF